MVLIETTIFARQVQAQLTEEEYRALQLHLVLHPDARSDLSPAELRILRQLVSSE